MASRAPAEQKRSGPESSPAPTPSRHSEAPRVRTSLKVSVPGDSAEREADMTARKVVAMRLPAARPTVVARVSVMPARAPAIPVSRPTAPPSSSSPPLARPPGETSPELEQAIRKELGGGKTLPTDVAEFMEPRFKANFGNVRIHTDGRAENLATRLGAKAFTYGRDIFFNAGQFKSDTSEGMELIAHELTHTIQQREVVQREAEPFAPVEVHESASPHVQRGIISRALDWIADKANNIPGFRLFTVVIGVNPVNMSRVERSGANILRALIEFIPGGHLIVEALENHKVFEKGGLFIEEQFRQLGMVGGAFRDALMNFIDSLGWRDIFHLGDLWDRAKRIFTDPIGKLIDFGKGLIVGIAKLVKDAILKPLAKWAAGKIPYWNLLVGVFGDRGDPISGEKESPADTLIGGFMELIGQKEIYDNIKKGKAVSKAWNWFKNALKGAFQLVASIPGRVVATIRSLTIWDIVTLVGAFEKIVGAFASFVADFGKWAFGTILDLLEIIFIVVAPEAVGYLKKAKGAFATIIKAPGRFIGYLVAAGRLGFNQFVKNFKQHLLDALFKWLLGSADGAGIYMPKGLQLVELLKFGLSVLGLTWANLRSKLVAATNETVVAMLETGFELVVTLVREGPAAAWKQLLENLSNLKNMVIDAVLDMVKSQVVEIAVTKILSFLSPIGAFIEAVRAIYRTVMFIVQKLKQIAALVGAFIDGLAAIASGNIGPAAKRVEDVLAKGMSLALAFLADFAGLGNIPKKVMALLKKIRDPVDKAMDKVVTWLVDQAKKAGRFLMKGAKRLLEWFMEKRSLSLADGARHTLSFKGTDKNARLMLASDEKPVEDHLNDAIKDASLPQKAINAAKTALKFYEANLKDISGKPIPDNPTGKLKQQIEALPQNLTTFASMLMTIGGEEELPTDAGWSWAGPASASGDFVSNRTSRGGQSKPSKSPKGWPLIEARGLTTRAGRWVKMHMISAGFGGLDLPGNLIPTPTAVNTGGAVRGFERQVEKILYGKEKAKEVRKAKTLWKRLEGRMGVIWVKTAAGGFWPAETDPLTGNQLYDASTFVRSVNLSAGVCFPAGGTWKKDPGVLASGVDDVPKPDFSGTYVPAVSDLGEPTLAKLAKIEPHFAREIAANGPFTSKSNFEDRMRKNRKGENISITPELRAAMAAVIKAVEQDKKMKWR